MEENIFFSVLICCYNSEKYISETIDSIVNQTYKNWELVIVNDGSTDSTEEIIFDYINKKVPIKYSLQENKGFAIARNKGLELAAGDWVALIDHDDICFLNRLEIQARHINRNIKAKLFFSNTVHFNEKGEIRKQYDRINPCELNLSKAYALNNLLIHGCFIDTESVVFNKEAALNIGGFDSRYKYVVDADFFKKFGAKYDMYAGEEVVSKWRVHDKQATQKMVKIIFQESIKMFLKYFTYTSVTNKTKIYMIFNISKLILKTSLIKFKLIDNTLNG